MRFGGSPRVTDAAVEHQAHVLNRSFLFPLDVAEVAGIVKSVNEHYRALWRAQGWHCPAWLDRQAELGRRNTAEQQALKGVLSGITRRTAVEDRDQRILARLAAGESTRKIAATVGLDHSTIVRIQRRQGGARTTNTDDPVFDAFGQKQGQRKMKGDRRWDPRSESFRPGGGPGEGRNRLPFDPPDPTPATRRRLDHWRDRHLRACICGRVWLRRRRKTCPSCGRGWDESICLTCDRVQLEDSTRLCQQPGEAARQLVKATAGDWEWARRAVTAAGGDIRRALVMLGRMRTRAEKNPKPKSAG